MILKPQQLLHWEMQPFFREVMREEEGGRRKSGKSLLHTTAFPPVAQMLYQAGTTPLKVLYTSRILICRSTFYNNSIMQVDMIYLY